MHTKSGVYLTTRKLSISFFYFMKITSSVYIISHLTYFINIVLFKIFRYLFYLIYIFLFNKCHSKLNSILLSLSTKYALNLVSFFDIKSSILEVLPSFSNLIAFLLEITLLQITPLILKSQPSL